jgi:succinyl-CoA synthetase beta subunit
MRVYSRERELLPYQARRVAYSLDLPADSIPKAMNFVVQLFKLFMDKDASLAEINPLILTKQGDVVALDAKINFDDNALYRHPELKELRDLDEEDPFEVEASKYGLNYVKLDGTVGCMVNGAGLAMSTMDIIQLAGGKPANFLDVGGGAKKDQIVNAFKILTSDKSVKAVLINIFGGILRCDVLAQGVVDAASELNLQLPVVIRMEGTNVEQGKEILRKSGMKFTIADGMKDAAEKVVALAK